ncbi:MAG TPA: hypothetical protein VGE39_01435 [Prosthecobacter sp.]
MSTATHEMTRDQQYAAVVEKMKSQGLRVPPRGAWREMVGHTKGSEHFAEAMKFGAQWREEVNRQSIEDLNAHS